MHVFEIPLLRPHKGANERHNILCIKNMYNFFFCMSSSSYMVNTCNGQKYFWERTERIIINEYLNMYLWAYFV